MGSQEDVVAKTVGNKGSPCIDPIRGGKLISDIKLKNVTCEIFGKFYPRVEYGK